MENTFRYSQLKIRATKLPGVLRCDPLAVVYTGSSAKWTEVGMTETRANEWNPHFAKHVTLPADNASQQGVELRVDLYNKIRADNRFLGTVSVHLSALLAVDGGETELVLETPASSKGKSRVFLRVLDGYNPLSGDGGGSFSLAFQLAQTQYWGVSMRVFYEISAAADGAWTPTFKSETAKLDRQGWGQFDTSEVSLRDLCRDDAATHLLFTLYRQKIIGHKRVLGTFQTSVQALARMQDGAFIHFSPNTKEDIISADIIVTHTRKQGMKYSVGLKLVNVRWNAPEVQEDNQLG